MGLGVPAATCFQGPDSCAHVSSLALASSSFLSSYPSSSLFLRITLWL